MKEVKERKLKLDSEDLVSNRKRREKEGEGRREGWEERNRRAGESLVASAEKGIAGES